MTFINRRNLFALGAAGAGILAAPRVLRAQTRSIADTLASDTRFQRLMDLIVRNSMVDTFRQPGPFTVFAPTAQAFLSAPAGILNDLVGNQESGNNQGDRERDRLGALINYHVVNGRFMAEELMGQNRNVNTVNGGALQLSSTGGGALTVRNPAPAVQLGATGAAGAQTSFRPANVTQANIPATNGVIHAIDQGLFP